MSSMSGVKVACSFRQNSASARAIFTFLAYLQAGWLSSSLLQWKKKKNLYSLSEVLSIWCSPVELLVWAYGPYVKTVLTSLQYLILGCQQAPPLTQSLIWAHKHVMDQAQVIFLSSFGPHAASWHPGLRLWQILWWSVQTVLGFHVAPCVTPLLSCSHFCVGL